MFCKSLNGKCRAMILFLITIFLSIAIAEEKEIRICKPKAIAWSSEMPADCPFPQSNLIKGVVFTGRSSGYTKADTWYPSWGADGKMYSAYTDGTVNGVNSRSGGANVVVGHAVIEGDDPLNLTVVEPGLIRGNPSPYGGRYPCGSLMHDGVWYIGTYALANSSYGLNWPILGPCPGFHISTDKGQTWTRSPLSCKPGNALFPEPAEFKGPVKIGAPHFIDFGKNMEHSPDGKAYLIGHGSVEKDQDDRKANLSWISGDQIYLCRVVPSVANINDESKYEYYAGCDTEGKAIWSWDYTDIKPLYEWDNNCGCVTMTYNAPMNKYLMCVTDGWPTISDMNTYILESDTITGPWKIVTYMKSFGPQAYFVNIPSKFISRDGRTVWLCYSANFTTSARYRYDGSLGDPMGSCYRMCLVETKLADEETWSQYSSYTTPVKSTLNLAATAQVTASSIYSGFTAEAVKDGVIDGYPGNHSAEWASNGEKKGAWIKLQWDNDQTVSRIWIFDRPNTHADHVMSLSVNFSDGSTIAVGELPDDAKSGKEITFATKTVSWVKVEITSVSETTLNVGLSEIAVFSEVPTADITGGGQSLFIRNCLY
jgi:hypothetical protein